MNIDDQINAYFDNTLSAEQESELFLKLAYNKDLRLDFSANMKINSAINDFKLNSAPPSELTLNIFSSAGYSMPALNVPKASLFPKSIFNYALVSIVSALVSVTLFSVFNKSIPIEYKHTYPQIKQLTAENNSIPISKIDTITQTKIKYCKNNESTKTNLTENPISDDKQDNSVDFQICKSNPISIKQNYDYNYRPSINTPSDINIDYQENKELSDISIELVSSINWNLPKETINPNEYSKFNNLSLALMYNLTSNFKIGLNIRQETFFNQYYETDAFHKYDVEMQPNLTSFGLISRYQLFDFNYLRLSPQLDLAFNKYGFIIRPGINVEYPITNQFSLVNTLDYSIFNYTRQSNWFNSKKLALSFGINYNF